MVDDLANKLQTELDVTTWRDLRAHAARDNLFLVAPDLSLVEVGQALATDQANVVEHWINQGQVARPTLTQMEDWEGDLEQTFQCLIISPFVLAQLPGDPAQAN